MSGLSIVTGPLLDPVSLAEAKDHCRITASDEDGILAGYLFAARQHVEDYLGRALISRTYDLLIDWSWPHDRCGGLRIELPMPPKISVTSVTYVDSAGVSQLLSPLLYQVSNRLGAGVIVPAYGQYWPQVRWQPDAITVRFVAGYGTGPGSIPEPIRHAILLMVGQYYENRENVVVGTTVTELPGAVRSLLSTYVTQF